MDTMSHTSFKRPSRLALRLTALIALIAAHPGLWAENQPSLSAHSALPQHDGYVHLGVASCASSVCHGAMLERTSTTVLQNEYVTWTRHDHHADAYNTLLTDASKRMATNLGLPNAHQADLCLDCHADNVPTAMQGPEFDITDGVGCEACHGGSETWAALHTVDTVPADELRQAGLYPAHDPVEATALCLSCHLGNEDKLATHKIMGAGHPRLSFELVTFLELLPPHWERDDEYLARKRAPDLLGQWIQGQLTTAKSSLRLLRTHLVDSNTTLPELAMFDCHACHHAMSDQRWQPSKLTVGVEPGTPRLNLAYFAFVEPLAQSLQTSGSADIVPALRALNQSAHVSPEQLSDILNEVSDLIDETISAAHQINERIDGTALLHRIAEESALGTYRDYSLAEQAAMAMNLLLEREALWEQSRPAMRAVFASLMNEEQYQPDSFASAVKVLLEVLPEDAGRTKEL